MWMLITQLYWKDLLKLRKYGRRLVTALISHHHLVGKTRTLPREKKKNTARLTPPSQIYSHPDRDILQPLLQHLTECLNTLLLSSPTNFVCPSTWSKYRDALKACLPPGDEARHNSFAAVNLRNEQLVAAANRSQPAARHILVRLLDGTLQSPMPDELPAQCWGVSKDKKALAVALLEWCTSLYRPGLEKVYVTSRILQHWSTLGLDVTKAVEEFLDNDTCGEQKCKATLYHALCELVRSGVFSVPHYLRWLINQGGLRNPEDVAPDGPCPTRLLAEMPTHALTASERDLRSGMLSRASYSVADEAQNAELAKKHLRRAFGFPLDPADPLLQRKPLSMAKLTAKIASASRALKAEIGYWLRSSFAASAAGEGDKQGAQAPAVSPTLFHAVRAVLEAAEDFSMLGDVLKALTDHAGVDILAAISDTVSRHLFVFSALGVSAPLFRSLHQRFRAAVREQGIALRPLLASLVALAPRIPGMEELASQLKRDLALSDRQNPVDVCSPVSDNMVARLQDDAAELHEEIEKLLAGGSSLDRNTMERLFQTVVQRLQGCWGTAAAKQRAYSSLLGRLRVFDTQHFDGLMAKWLLYLRTLGNRPSILRIFPLLVSVGCLDLGAILATASEFPGGQGAAGAARAPGAGPQVVQLTYRTRYMQEVLLLLTGPIPRDGLMTPDEAYRFGILQDQAVTECAKEVLGLIFLALAEYSYARGQNDLEGLPLDSLEVQDQLLALLKRLVLRDATGVARALSVRSPNAEVNGWIDTMTTKLLIPTADGHMPVTFDQVLELTNEFTLPFCQVKLALSLGANEANSQEAVDRQQSHVELFASAMDKAISAGNISWVGMLSCLSPEITQHLKARAQNRFLDLLPSVRSPPATKAALAQNLQMAENLLSVMDAIMRGSPPGARQPQPTPAVVDKLVDLWELLAAPEGGGGIGGGGDDQPNGAPPAYPNPKAAVLRHWLPLVLNFVTLHAHAFDLGRPSSELRARMLVACAGLMQELDVLHSEVAAAAAPEGGDGTTTTLTLQVQVQQLSRRLFDLSCLLVDNLAEDARALCVRAVRDAAAVDARLRYIFSVAPADVGGAEAGLALLHRDRGGSAAGLAASGSGSGGGGGAMFGGLLGTPAALWGVAEPRQAPERLSVFQLRRWEALSEPTPNVGENDTALSLGLFEARRVQ